MAGDKDKKKRRSSKKGSKDRAKSRAKPLDAEAFECSCKGDQIGLVADLSLIHI